MLPVSAYTLSLILIASLMLSYASPLIALGTEDLLREMEEAYAGVKDYQAKVEVRTYKGDGSFETQKFLYTFKKPEWIRLDLESPHSGTVLVYPDKNGKVVIRPSGIAHFFKLHLEPDNFLLMGFSGQRMDQTDTGLLIRNIAHSLTDQCRGPVEVTEKEDSIQVRVLADNHFRKGVVTLYQFLIHKQLRLPVKVEESTPDGLLERAIVFQNLRTNIAIPDSLFQVDE